MDLGPERESLALLRNSLGVLSKSSDSAVSGLNVSS